MTFLELPRALIGDTDLLECDGLFLWLGWTPFKVYGSGWLRGPCPELLSQSLFFKKVCGRVYVCFCTKVGVKWRKRTRSEKHVGVGIPNKGCGV